MSNWAAKAGRAVRSLMTRRSGEPFVANDIECLVGRPGSTLRLKADNPGLRVADWLREEGRGDLLAEASARSETPVTLSPPEAAARFVVWVREMDLAGTWTDKEIQGLYEWWLADERVVAMAWNVVAPHIKRQLGVRHERIRLKAVAGVEGRVTQYRILDQVSHLVLAKAA